MPKMVVLALNWKRKWKITILVCLMVITEFCIILIYQRGGWLSYPLTLIIIWFCVYILDSDSKDFSFHIRAMRSSLLKIVITLPVTIAISLSLVYLTTQDQTDSRQQLSSFTERAGSITNANDRIKYWEPAFLMARLHTLFGPGVESFSSQYEKIYIAPGHLYSQTPKYDIAPYYGSSHNLYFQALAGKGFLGLLSLFGVMLAAITLVWRGIFAASASRLALSQPQRLLLMMTLAYTCALAIYGNVGEIFYSPIGYILFVLFFAASIGGVPPTYELSRRFRSAVLMFIAIAFVIHLYLEFKARFGI
jgi:O-antigen ligase